VLRAGMVVVNVNPLYTPRELEHQLRDSGAAAIVVLENFAHTLEQVIGSVPIRIVVTTQVGDLLPPVKRLLTNAVVKHVKKLVPMWQLAGAVDFKRALALPRWFLMPGVTALAFVSVYAVNGSVFDVGIMTVMGLVGYLLRKFDFEAAPIGIGLVLAPTLEISLRQSLILSRGSYVIFLARPIAATLLAAAAAVLLLALLSVVRRALRSAPA